MEVFSLLIHINGENKTRSFHNVESLVFRVGYVVLLYLCSTLAWDCSPYERN